MPLEYSKKNTNSAKKNQTDAPARDAGAKKKGLGLLGFAAGAKALVPKENTKDGAGKTAEPKKKDRRTLGAKIDDYLGLGARLQTTEWCQRKWRESEEEIGFQGIDGMLEKYRQPMMTFFNKEFSAENANALLALNQGMSMKDFYARFLDPNSPEEININKQNEYAAYAKDGEFSKIDPTHIRKGLMINMSDTFSRMIFDPDVLKAVFQRLTNMTAPDKVGGGYRDTNDE